ncbi:MAG: OmpH family outer membrane protein, partial [Halanaerobiales bacterium]
ARNDNPEKIAYVDIQDVFNQHPDKIAAEEDLNDLARNMQTELEKKTEDLSEEEQQKLLEQYQQELTEKENEMIEQILNEIEQLVNRVADEEDVKMVLDKKNVVFGGYDLTPEVIERIKQE